MNILKRPSIIFRKNFLCLNSLAAVFLLAGCQTIQPRTEIQDARTEETAQDARKALGSVAGAVAGKELGDEDLKKLGRDLREDPQAQSAVEKITEALSGRPAVVKYCPLTGKRYSPELETCPVHGVALEILEE